MAHKVIIIGGGYIGSELAQALDPVAEVTLVEPRAAFVHVPATIRAVALPQVLDRAILPYDRLLGRGQVLRARARAVGTFGVQLDDDRILPADFVVVATGSGYAAPFKPAGDNIESLRGTSRSAHAALVAANRVAIVGAGAVGIELAGEIKAAMPAKSVTLISETAQLLPDYPARLGRELGRKLDLLGVEVIAGHRAERLSDMRAPFAGDLTLDDGRIVAADLVFPVIGARPVTDLFQTLPDARFAPDGRVLTDNWMRPSSLPNVFAAGDAAANGDAMTIVGATRQTPWLARTLKALIAGRQLGQLPGYKPWHKPPILLPLGEYLGNSYLPVGVVGNGPTRLLKGRSLFIPKYRKQFGLN
ncbi:FAD-dependent oxidoreductase [Tropicimonas sp.]|uniref:FAD-dependent oxidoreductase n=1 Tax=Tropicimonas sp. TaxID=2067044 RepID=UPI003A8AEDF7